MKNLSLRREALRATRQAFTLIELLVVIAIIALLAAILFPVFGRARENARRTSCLSNVRQLGMAYYQYAQDNDERFPYSKGSTPWTVSTEPYLKSKAVLRCPSDTRTDWVSDFTLPLADGRRTSYTINAYTVPGEAKREHGGNFAGLHMIQKPSSLIMIAEGAEYNEADLDGAGRPKAWNQIYFHAHLWGNGVTNSRWNDTTQRPGDIIINRHFDGFNAGYADGHAKWVKWDQVWWRDDSVIKATTKEADDSPVNTPSMKGNFDPRQN